MHQTIARVAIPSNPIRRSVRGESLPRIVKNTRRSPSSLFRQDHHIGAPVFGLAGFGVARGDRLVWAVALGDESRAVEAVTPNQIIHHSLCASLAEDHFAARPSGAGGVAFDTQISVRI